MRSALSARAGGPPSILIAGAWLLGLGLVAALRGLALGDETTFLAEGRRILAGELPPIFRFPVTAAALSLGERVAGLACALPACVPSLWAGRLVVGTCLVVSGLATAAFLREAGAPAAARMALLLFPVFPSVVLLVDANASHWMTLALFPLAAWFMLRACSRRSAGSAAAAALAVALACLARPDGVGLAALAGLALAGAAERGARARIAGTYALTVTLALGAVSAAYAATGQSADWTYRERSYLAFEQGYGHVFPARITGSPWFEGRRAAERVYGTADENGHSIVRAALRHPGAFAERLGATVAQGARLLAVVLSVSVPLLTGLIAGVAASGREQRRFHGLAVETLRAMALGGAFAVTLAPYVLTFYRKDYFLHVLWLLIAVAAAAAARLAPARLRRPVSGGRPAWILGALVVGAGAGLAGSALKVVDWQRQGMPVPERLAVVRALAAGTEPGARVWAATPHLARHAGRAPARVEIATPRSCDEVRRALDEFRPTHVLAEVRDAGAGRSSIEEADLRQVPVLVEGCGLGGARAIELPEGIHHRWQLFHLVY